MDDLFLRLGKEGGPILGLLALVSLFTVKYLMPFLREALAAHQADLQRILDDGKAGQQTVIAAFRESLDRSERQGALLVNAITDKLGVELAGVRKDMDRVSDALEGLRSDLTGTGEFKRVRPPSGSAGAGLVLLFCALLTGACSAPLVHQQRLAELHTRAARQCKTQVLTCAALAPCSSAVRTALADWQAVSAAASKGDDAGEAAALVVAASSEVGAYGVCKEVSK